MSEFIAFCVGFIVGGLFGVFIMILLIGAKKSGEELEIEVAIDRIEKGSRGGEE